MARRTILCFAALFLPACFAEIDTSLIEGLDAGSTRDGSTPRVDAGFTCPSDMLLIAELFCVDRLEATKADYQRFLESDPSQNQPNYCRFNISFEPLLGWPPPEEELQRPVVMIDWCDARAYCSWAGKRLCGAIGGGSADLDDINNLRTNEWTFACSREGDRAYPYGDNYQAGRCNGDDTPNGTANAGSFAQCSGGYDGLFDMSGNVEEWQNACERSSGANDDCAASGGGFMSDQNDLRCGSVTEARRSEPSPQRGVRCCRDP